MKIWHHFGDILRYSSRKKLGKLGFKNIWFFWRTSRCSSGSYETFRVPGRCQATPARWSGFKGKTEAGKQKAPHLGQRCEPKGGTSDNQTQNYQYANFLKGYSYMPRGAFWVFLTLTLRNHIAPHPVAQVVGVSGERGREASVP